MNYYLALDNNTSLAILFLDMSKKRSRKEAGRAYFAWNPTLENHLIQSMVELANDNHIQNGSFKGGAFKELEKLMEQKSPGCGILAYPNIKSKLKIIKQRFQAYQLCKSQSGRGLG